MSKSYTSSTSIYAGVSSAVSLDEESKTGTDYFSINSTYDNLINLTKARGSLEKTALRLLSQSYVKGSQNEDTEEIKKENYKNLMAETPQEVKEFINKKSESKTLKELTTLYHKNRTNFIYQIINGDDRFFSCNALSKVSSKRLGSSDLIEIEYTTSDPGLAESTVRFISQELLRSYEDLRFSASNDVVAYFERELKRIKAQLRGEENEMTQFSIANNVLNYYEQSKALAIHATDFNARYQEILEQYESSDAAIKEVDKKMDIRAKLLQTNKNFLQGLDQIAKSSEYTITKEVFNSQENTSKDIEFQAEQQKIADAEKDISKLADNIDVYNYDKRGVGITDMVTIWLDNVITNTKAKAQLKAMDKWKTALAEQYRIFSPVGTMLGRYERTIGSTEEQLNLTLHGLHLAKLKQKSIQLNTATLKIITDPTYPFSGNNKRWIYIFAAFFGSMLFIIGIFLIIELLDRTLRDELRTARLTKTPVLGAFTGYNNIKFRGYTKACNRIATLYAANRLNPYLKPGETCIINLLSLQKGEGKSFFAQFLADHWKDMGFDITIIKAGEDFDPNTKDYILAQRLDEIWNLENSKKPNIVLVEYSALSSNNPPLLLLKEAKINLLICNACRLWNRNDDILLAQIKKELGEDTPIYIYLNNADRYAVESFTGDLPPQLPIQSFFKRLFSLGLTSQKASVN